MEVWKLKEEYQRRHPDGHFFDHDTLKFFGERESEMRVLKNKANVNGRECYILSSLQRKNPLGPRRAYHYFDMETFDNIVE